MRNGCKRCLHGGIAADLRISGEPELENRKIKEESTLFA